MLTRAFLHTLNRKIIPFFPSLDSAAILSFPYMYMDVLTPGLALNDHVCVFPITDNLLELTRVHTHRCYFLVSCLFFNSQKSDLHQTLKKFPKGMHKLTTTRFNGLFLALSLKFPQEGDPLLLWFPRHCSASQRAWLGVLLLPAFQMLLCSGLHRLMQKKSWAACSTLAPRGPKAEVEKVLPREMEHCHMESANQKALCFSP